MESGEDGGKAARERAFHNETFASGTRERVRPFYRIAAASMNAYRGRVKSLAPGKRVLELGAGVDGLAAELARSGVAVVSIDVSDVAVRSLEGAAPACLMDGERLGFANDSFDLVCGKAILHHLATDLAAAEIARVLRPAGRAVFYEPLGHNPLINAYRNRTPDLRTADEHPLLMDDITRLRERFGHVAVDYRCLLALSAAPLGRLPGHGALVGALHGADQLLFALAPPLRRYAWIVRIELAEPRR